MQKFPFSEPHCTHNLVENLISGLVSGKKELQATACQSCPLQIAPVSIWSFKQGR